MKNLLKRNLALLLAIVLLTGFVPYSVQADTITETTDRVQSSSTVQLKITGVRDYSYAFKVLKLVNSERKKAGLSALKMDKRLLETAMERAAECQVMIVVDHTRPDGSEWSTNYPSAFAWQGENIAIGQVSPADVMNSWMNSSGHKANILSSNYNAIGIGCYKVGNYYTWVQSFGSTDKIKKAKQSSYTSSKKTYTITASPANLTYTVSVSDKSPSKGSSSNISISLATYGFEYNTYKLSASQFKYTSSDTKVASVDSKGKITAKSSGKTNITIKYKSGGKTLAKGIAITVE